MTLINGYELFALCLGKEPSESLMFDEVIHDFGDGYESEILTGSNTGLRSWSLSYPTLTDFTSKTLTVNGVTMTHAQYVWDLFQRTKVSGKPFVIKSSKNGQYYLAKFADKELSEQRIYAKVISVGLKLKQVRIKNVSVFDVSALSPFAWYQANAISGSDEDPVENWADSSGNNHLLVMSEPEPTPPTIKAESQNNLITVEFGAKGTDTTPFKLQANLTVHEIYLVAKYGGNTFGGNNGAVSSFLETEKPFLVGNQAGGNKWFNTTDITSLSFEKNGFSFIRTAMPSPMNTFTLSRLRLQEGVSVTGLKVGGDRTFGVPRYWVGHFAEIIVFNKLLSESNSDELTEYLLTKWNL
jgi:hypothetical protein